MMSHWECITNYIKQIDFLELAGTCSNPVELTAIINKQEVDIIFLDIQMPVINGIDFLRMKHKLSIVIITTAYPSYALEGFQLDVLDYLVKPITFNRFFQGVTKARDYQQLLRKPDSTGSQPVSDYFFIKCDYRYEKIYFSDIMYIEAMQNYVTIYTQKGKYMTLLYLKNIEENLDKQYFVRVHKSYLVSISRIDSIENNEIVIGSFRIPMSRNYRDEVIEQVVNKRLWKK
jgi:DNA-binding LytR/AlgR family response regulator